MALCLPLFSPHRLFSSFKPSCLAQGGFCPHCPGHPQYLFCRADSGHWAHPGMLMCLLRATGFMSATPATCLGCEFIVSSFLLVGTFWGWPVAAERSQQQGLKCMQVSGVLFTPHLHHPRYLTSSCSVALRPEVWGLFPASPWPCARFQPTCHPQRSQTPHSSKTGALWGP